MTLSNYQDNGHGIQPLSAKEIHGQLPEAITERLRRYKGHLVAMVDDQMEFLHDATMFFARLNLELSVDWEVGPGLVTKDEFFLFVRHHARVMKREEVMA